MRHLMILALVMIGQAAIGQKYFSKTGKISFYSKAPLETIEAHNNSATTVLDLSTGNLEWAVLIQGFTFEKALMQEHFNENYMESSTYPKAKFRGKIDNYSSLNLTKEGVYAVSVSGQLEIHGVSQPVTAQGTIAVKGGQITAKSNFSIALADYGIEIPKLVADNIAKKVDIRVDAEYQSMIAMP